MNDKQHIPHLLKRLWGHIAPRRRRQLGLLLILTILTSFAEILSIGAVLPFLGMLTAPERVFAHPAAQPVISYLGIAGPQQLLLPATLAFACAALVAGGMRLGLLWGSTRLAFATGADLSHEIYRRTLYQPYQVHLSRNSSEIISGISSKVNEVIYGVMFPALMIISAVVMLLAILAALLSIDPKIALVAVAGFGCIYLLVVRLTRRRLAHNSERIARESVQVIKALQEGLGGIRDVLLDGTQPVYCNIYRSADVQLRRAQGSNQFMGNFPRFGIEALGMVLIAALAYSMASQPAGIVTAIPVLGALALGAQRLLPVLQQAYGNWTAIRAAQVSLRDALELLEQPLPEHLTMPVTERLAFDREIEIRDVSFRYRDDTPWILNSVSLRIPKGGRIGFVGATGSGKSTLLDLLMGLLRPVTGEIFVDGAALEETNLRAWQARIAHVPQAIYLADTTIAENIAFGVPSDQIDLRRVELAAHQAQIAETIESWSESYATRVGERGVRLSGGQRQRIGIARALYKQADVIIFDEATSALDSETEQAVMQAIESLSPDLTILIIAHRLSTLSKCTQIVEMQLGKRARVGTFQEVIAAPSNQPTQR